MAIEQALVPSFVKVMYDGKEIVITDATFSIHYSNNSKYEACLTADGKKGYMLRKGTNVDQIGKIQVVITKTPDGRADDTINTLMDVFMSIRKSENPADYVKSIAFVFSDPGEEQFLSVSFAGYLSKFNRAPSKVGNKFSMYTAEFTGSESSSFTIGN